MTQKVIRNKHLRSPVTVIQESTGLDQAGRAGVRLKLDMMLSAAHGHTPGEWARLSGEERAVLRKIAAEEDRAWGVSHQADAIGALGELGDRAALLQLGETARNRRADPLVRIAATHALGRIGSGQAVPVLHDLLADTVPEVRAQAAVALGTVGGAGEVARLDELGRQDRTFVGTVAKDAATALRNRLGLR
jgi:hypothetical protein